MSNLYPSHQAEVLLNKLAADAVLRTQLLQNPQETLSQFGFEVDPSELTQSRKIASEAILAESAGVARRQKEHERQGTLAIFIFLHK